MQLRNDNTYTERDGLKAQEVMGTAIQPLRSSRSPTEPERPDRVASPQTAADPRGRGAGWHCGPTSRRPAPCRPARLTGRTNRGRPGRAASWACRRYVPFQPVGIGVGDEGLAVGADHAHQLIVVDHAPAPDRAQLLPHAMVGPSGAGAEQIVDAAVEGVTAARPCGAEAAGQIVHLEDLRTAAVHPAMPG
jgi:hypothetical protein